MSEDGLDLAQREAREILRTSRERNRPLPDDINHPTRYTKGKVECIEAIESAVVGKTPEEAVLVAPVIKYVWRYEEKEGVRDLYAARWYLNRLIDLMETRIKEL